MSFRALKEPDVTSTSSMSLLRRGGAVPSGRTPGYIPGDTQPRRCGVRPGVNWYDGVKVSMVSEVSILGGMSRRHPRSQSLRVCWRS